MNVVPSWSTKNTSTAFTIGKYVRIYLQYAKSVQGAYDNLSMLHSDSRKEPERKISIPLLHTYATMIQASA